VVDRESIAARASGKAWAVFTDAPTWVASERCVETPSEARAGAPVDVSKTVPGVSVADWLLLHSASYDRMPELAIELAERGGVDIEYCETPSTNLVTEDELVEAGGPQELLRPIRAAGGVEADWIDGDALRELFPSLNPVYAGGTSTPAGQVEPYRFCLGMAQAAEKLGAEFRQGEVVDFSTRGDAITGVRLASGTLLQADAVVLAPGPWVGMLSARLGCPLGCRPVFSEDATIVEHRGDLLAMAPTPPHQKPVMGRLPGWRNGYVAARFGGDGVSMSPAAGELVAELIDTAREPLRARRMFECLAPASAGR
jgi:glycine/D-amino acid oxidase-like deaminating enzyme